MKVRVLDVLECLKNKETFIEGMELFENIFEDKKCSMDEKFMFITGYKIGKEIGKQNV